MRRAMLENGARAFSTALLGVFSTSSCMPKRKKIAGEGGGPSPEGGGSIMGRMQAVAGVAQGALPPAVTRHATAMDG